MAGNGLVLALLFFVFQAPDVALSELAVGTAAVASIGRLFRSRPSQFTISSNRVSASTRVPSMRGGQAVTPAVSPRPGDSESSWPVLVVHQPHGSPGGVQMIKFADILSAHPTLERMKVTGQMSLT